MINMDNINIIFNKLGSMEASLNEIKENTKSNTEDIKQLKQVINELQSSIEFIYNLKQEKRNVEQISISKLLVIASFINIAISSAIFLLSRFL